MIAKIPDEESFVQLRAELQDGLNGRTCETLHRTYVNPEHESSKTDDWRYMVRVVHRHLGNVPEVHAQDSWQMQLFRIMVNMEKV